MILERIPVRSVGMASVSSLVVLGVMAMTRLQPASTTAATVAEPPSLVDEEAGLMSRVVGPLRTITTLETPGSADAFGPFRSWDDAVVINDFSEADDRVHVPVVTGMMHGRAGPRVILNGEIHAEGDSLSNGWSVVSIEPLNRVVILSDADGQRYRRSLSLPALTGVD